VAHYAVKNLEMASHPPDLTTLDLILLRQAGIRLSVVLHNVEMIGRAPSVTWSALLKDLMQVAQWNESERRQGTYAALA
jgi:hypothetical protein